MQYHRNNLASVKWQVSSLVHFIRIRMPVKRAHLRMLLRMRVDASIATGWKFSFPHVRRRISRRSIRRARYPSRRERRQRISIDPEHGPILIMGATRRSTYPRVSRSHVFPIRPRRRRRRVKRWRKIGETREATQGDCGRASGALASVTPTIYRATRIYPIQTFARCGIDRYWKPLEMQGRAVASWSTCWKRPQLRELECGCEVRRWAFDSSSRRSSSFRPVPWFTRFETYWKYSRSQSTIELNCWSSREDVCRKLFTSRQKIFISIREIFARSAKLFFSLLAVKCYLWSLV